MSEESRHQPAGAVVGHATGSARVYPLSQVGTLLPHDAAAVVGGKAAGLAMMAGELGFPVPPGFVVGTWACREYLQTGWPAGLDAEIAGQLPELERLTGRSFGGAASPLLVSVRSGAAVSMPGMMDTILNLGLNEQTTMALAAATGDLQFAQSCRSRFESMFRRTVGTGDVPDDPGRQLRAAIEAVFQSWHSDRARAYRARTGISDDLGTAVTVQAMVFGNLGPDSATGVLFTRDPATGERALFGDIMFGAQGEDVVAGSHRTQPLATLRQRLPAVAADLQRYADVLERHFGDLCEIEFTIERGKLWMLQVRIGKRSRQAALRIAAEMAEDASFPLSKEQAVRRVAALLAHQPTIRLGDPGGVAALAHGLPASPGLATGELAIAPPAADTARPVILVRAETSPEDVPAMSRAAGILTTRGGLASHAAVIAREWGIPAVVGAADVEVTGDGAIVAGRFLPVGHTLTVDGSSGAVYDGAVAGHDAVLPEAAALRQWASDLGIDLRTEPGGDSQLPGDAAQQPVTAGDLLHLLSIKTFSTAEAAAEALQVGVGQLGEVIAELTAAGLVLAAAGTLQLTAEGASRAAGLLQAEQAAGGVQAAASLAEFTGLDQELKQTVTAWQLRATDGTEVINDHADAAYDAAVLARLARLNVRAAAWLGPLAGPAPRLAGYLSRLDRAAGAVARGDHRFVSSPRVDSYHSIWFELHEYLIRLAGRSRADEESAGP